MHVYVAGYHLILTIFLVKIRVSAINICICIIVSSIAVDDGCVYHRSQVLEFSVMRTSTVSICIII